jgi:glycosyltransferase involved in cell wall biosynthesis
MTRVGAITAEAPGTPGVQVRVHLPAAALEREGVRVTPLSVFSEAEAERAARSRLAAKTALALRAHRRTIARLRRGDPDFDVALVYRRADMLPSLAIERLAAAGRPLVYDVDDAIWLDGAPGSGTHPLAWLKRSAGKVRWLATRADRVIAGNAILAEHLAQFSSSVSVVPSLVDPAAIPVRSHVQGPEVVVGWIGSVSTAPFLAALRPVLARVAAQVPATRLRVVAVGGELEPIEGVVVESRPWSEGAQRDVLARLDIGVMPLPDTEWNRGKCAYKALQYMAAGVPAVADDVGIVRDVIGHDRAGHVVRDAGEWVESLVALVRDERLRGRLGAAGRDRVERDFSIARWAPELAALLRADG